MGERVLVRLERIDVDPIAAGVRFTVSEVSTLVDEYGVRDGRLPRGGSVLSRRRSGAGLGLQTRKRVAGALLRIGVKKGDRVAFLLPNCGEFLFATFAVTAIPFGVYFAYGGRRRIVCQSIAFANRPHTEPVVLDEDAPLYDRLAGFFGRRPT